MREWEEFLALQERELGHETVKKWLRTLKIIKYDAWNLHLEAKDPFQALWFEEHIRSKAVKSFRNGNERPIQIHLKSPLPKKEPPVRGAVKKGRNAPAERSFAADPLDPSLTLEEFLFENDNQLIRHLLNDLFLAYETRPLGVPPFNPIYFYGAEGSGKSHLLTGIALQAVHLGLKTLYIRAETFAGHVVSAIRSGEMAAFRQAYRNLDLLLVDDVDFFSKKGATQEEFFHTFNTLHLAGKGIILSARTIPSELPSIEPRLVSRFEWGIVLPTHSLEETRLPHMLRKKSEQLRLPFSDALLAFLATTFSSRPARAVQALQALALRISHTHTEAGAISPVTASAILSDLIREEKRSALTPAKIVQKVAEYYGVREEDLLGKGQKKEFTLPRQLAMALCREKLKMPFMKIGELFDRDHSTVMASVRRIQKAQGEGLKEILHPWHILEKRLIESH